MGPSRDIVTTSTRPLLIDKCLSLIRASVVRLNLLNASLLMSCRIRSFTNLLLSLLSSILRLRSPCRLTPPVSPLSPYVLQADLCQVDHDMTLCVKKVTRSSTIAEIARIGGHYAVQGHSRSPTFAPIDSLYITSYL